MNWTVPLLLIAVTLGGCLNTDPGQIPTTPDELAEGTGAIAGLLVDDRFRPIELTEGPGTNEFQAQGFVLVQETGDQVQTNDAGEFIVADLSPGTYTLRATAAGHEATPQTVQVRAGEFNEISIVARRIVSDAGLIVSTEYAAFVPCGANLIFYGDSFDCTLDQSGDSDRAKFTIDYTQFEASYFVMEMRSNSPQFWDVWLQPPLDDSASCGETYQIMGGPDSTYERWQLKHGESAVSSPTASGADCETVPWVNDTPLQTYVYLNSLGFEEGIGFGLGVYVGVQANFVQNLFVGPPEVDVDSYCVICS